MSFFGLFLSLLTYMIGLAIKKKFKSGLANPLLIAIILTIAFLLIGKIDYETYNAGAKYLTYLLTPSTICLALPLYQQIEKMLPHPASPSLLRGDNRMVPSVSAGGCGTPGVASRSSS